MVNSVLNYVLACINTPFDWFSGILNAIGGVDLYLSVIALFLFFRLILLPLVRGNVPVPVSGPASETRNFIREVSRVDSSRQTFIHKEFHYSGSHAGSYSRQNYYGDIYR